MVVTSEEQNKVPFADLLQEGEFQDKFFCSGQFGVDACPNSMGSREKTGDRPYLAVWCESVLPRRGEKG